MLKRFHLVIGLIFSVTLVSLTVNKDKGPVIPTGPYLLSYPPGFGNRINLPTDRLLTKQEVYLGRMLFYETKLSVTNTISCASCHQQALAFTDGKKFSTGVDGTLTKRNSMSLTNMLWVRNFFWDGRSTSLEEQAKTPMTDPHEMGQSLEVSAQKLQQTKLYPSVFKLAFGTDSITGERIIKAITQFERTLITAHSPYDQYLEGTYQPTAQELNGMRLFSTGPSPDKKIRGGNCIHCHSLPKTSSELFHNNGLDRVAVDLGREQFTGQAIDRGRFRVPTLRNSMLTSPYMHDGRFTTLKEVVDHYNDHIQPSSTLSPFITESTNEVNGKSLLLTQTEKDDIISFLRMLTDSTFITNPEFSNPHLLKISIK